MAYKVLQTNLGRARAAHDIMWAAAVAQDIDIVFVSEPNRRITSRDNWIVDESGVVAALVRGRGVKIERTEVGRGYVHVDCGGIHFYATYISPNVGLDVFTAAVDRVFGAAAGHAGRSLILGDLNAKSPLWGSTVEDARGRYVGGWMAQLGLRAANSAEPTFVRGASKSSIDVTLFPERMPRGVTAWKICNENPFTHHGHIYFQVGNRVRGGASAPKRTKIDEHIFRAHMRRGLEGVHQDGPMATYRVMKSATAAASVGVNGTGARRVPYWWDEHVEGTYKEHLKLKRILTRLRRVVPGDDPRVARADTNLKQKRKELKKSIKKAKRRQWRELIGELEGDIWGEAYRVATRQLRSGALPFQLSVKRRRKVLGDLFPAAGPPWRGVTADADGAEVLTMEELERAVAETKVGRAPGPDGITAEVVRWAFARHPEELLNMYARLFRERCFPPEWKEARVVLLPKRGKDLNISSSFRPLCLLSVAGKVFERIILNRLTEELDQVGGISEDQHGFRRGRSTTTAIIATVGKAREADRWCAIATIDIKNAFNTAGWTHVVEALVERGISPHMIGCVQAYFGDRVIRMGSVRRRCTAGVPQGSVLGPTLWNIMYDGVLRVRHEAGVSSTAYADDLALVVEATDGSALREKVERAVLKVIEWIEEMGMVVALEKTEILLVKGPRSSGGMVFRIQGCEIRAAREITYLGVVLRRGPSFSGHVEAIIAKASGRAAALRGIMPNMGGPGYAGRRILAAVIHSTVLYAAPVWRCVLRQERQKGQLISLQRQSLLRVISAYRTVSAEAAQVLSGYPPLDLMVAEVCFLFTVGGGLPGNRRMARRRTLAKWQERWAHPEASKARWTRRLIADVSAWVECRFRRVDYYVTQFFTGHGSFGTFTRRIGKTAADVCVACGVTDDPEHVYASCSRWSNERAELQADLGFFPDVEEIVPFMLRSDDKWSRISRYLREVMSRKEREDRDRQG